MNFADSKPIYRQIAERLEDEVVAGLYAEDGRAPSVREYSALLQVNVNTVARAFETLAQDGVVVQRRGLGYYITPGARELILTRRRENFLSERIPAFVRDMKRYGVGMEEVEKCLNHIQTL